MPSSTYRTPTAYPTLNRFVGRGGAGNLAHVDKHPAKPPRDAQPPTSFTRAPLAAVRSNSASSASSASSSAFPSASNPSDAASKAFASTGRGGSGNMARRSSDGPAETATSSAAARRAAASRQRAEQHVHERPMFSFDEELERQRRVLQHAAPVYHYFGRGGAGNRAPATADPATAGGAVGGASSVGAMPVRRPSDSSVCSDQGQDDGWSRWRGTGTR
jgi:Protein of unknown function (DUF3602)